MAGNFHNAHFLIPEILWQQLKTRSRESKQPMTTVVNQAIQLYLKTPLKTPAKKPTPKNARAGKPTSTR